MKDLEWTPQYNTAEAILKDAWDNDYVLKKAAGKVLPLGTMQYTIARARNFIVTEASNKGDSGNAGIVP